MESYAGSPTQGTHFVGGEGVPVAAVLGDKFAVLVLRGVFSCVRGTGDESGGGGARREDGGGGGEKNSHTGPWSTNTSLGGTFCVQPSAEPFSGCDDARLLLR